MGCLMLQARRFLLGTTVPGLLFLIVCIMQARMSRLIQIGSGDHHPCRGYRKQTCIRTSRGVLCYEGLSEKVSRVGSQKAGSKRIQISEDLAALEDGEGMHLNPMRNILDEGLPKDCSFSGPAQCGT